MSRLALTWRPFSFELPRAMVTAHGVLERKRGWLLRLEGARGALGWGEAAPLSAAQGETGSHGPDWRGLESMIQGLGVSVDRAELEIALLKLPLPLAFAVGSALAELDGWPATDTGPGQARGWPAGALPVDAFAGDATTTDTCGHGPIAERQEIHGPGRGPQLPGGWMSAPPSAVLLPAGSAMPEALQQVLKDVGTLAQGGVSEVAPGPPAPLTVKWKVAVGADHQERALLELLLAGLPADARLRLDANGGWDRPTAAAWAERLAGEERLEWLEQPLAPSDHSGLEALAAKVPVALDESLRAFPDLRRTWAGWQVRRPALEGDPRPFWGELRRGAPRRMLSTALETGLGQRLVAHLAALQAAGPTPAAPGLAPGWCPGGPLFARDPERVWAAALEQA